jgi:hypothetical protein
VSVLDDIVALERDPEKEPQCRYGLVAGRHTNAAASEMQLIAANVLEACGVWRSPEERREFLTLCT